MTPSPCTIRPVGPADRESWLQMRQQLWPDHRQHRQDIENYFARTDPEAGRVWVAVHEDQCRGFIEVTVRDVPGNGITSNVATIEGWFVSTDFREAGLGARLMETVEAWAKEQGIGKLISDCPLDNTTSAAAHRACGFIETARIITFEKELL